jgi:hypothetical protein
MLFIIWRDFFTIVDNYTQVTEAKYEYPGST